MTQWIMRKRVVLIALLVMALLISAGVISYRSMHDLRATLGAVDHTQAVLLQLEDVISTLKDIENGARGFIITGSENFLEPHTAGLQTLEPKLDRVRRLIADNPRQQMQYGVLAGLATRKIAIMKEFVKLRREQGFSSAAAQVGEGAGKRAMDQARRVVADMQQEERRLLALRTMRSKAASERSEWWVLLNGLLATVLIAIALWTINREFNGRRQAEEQLRHANDGLEQLVQQRTAELRRANEILRESSERWRVTLSSIGDGIIVTDAQGQLTFLNPVAEALTGWQQDHAAGQSIETVFNIVNEDTRAVVENPVERVLREGIIVGLANHTLLIDRQGVERLIDDSGAPIKNEAGDIIGAVLVFRDISERALVEQALSDSEQRYRHIAEALPVLVWSSLPDGSNDFFNQRWSEYTGLSAAESQGDGWIKLLHPDDTEHALPRWQQALSTGEPYETELRLRRADGTYRWCMARAVAMRGADGHITRWFGTCSDIDDQKRSTLELKTLAENLERSNRELEVFASVASHDLQEPLRKIQMLSERLQTVCADVLPYKGLDYLMRMQQAAQRMHHLVQDLLAFSRVTSKPRVFAPVALNTLARAVLSDLEALIEDTGGTVELGDLPTLPGDATQLRQLLQNLIGNGLKFHRPDCAPRVKLYAYPLRVRHDGAVAAYDIIVEDNGIGFETQFAERIFGLFERLHGRAEYEGTGIGLAVCRKIVERHGGTIRAESELGRGAKFIISLPTGSAG